MAAPSFDLTTTNAGAVAGICRRLDGLPLAIVLAAARIELFGTPGALLQRLEEDLSVLKSAAPDLPERQKTLQVAISWSYDLLTEEEQRLFRRLAVFVGGHTVEAVEKVCNRDKDLGMDVLDGVGALLDKSLIEARTGSDAGRRFTMLQTIGDYAGVRLEQSGELGKIRQYHAEYYLQFAEQAAAALSGAEQQSWLQRLDAEHDNLLAAQRWTAEQQEEEIDVRLAAALWRYWDVRGYLTEGRHYLAGTLQRTSEPSQERAQVLYGASVLAWRQGDFKPAQSYLEECLTVSEEVAYRRGRADALNMMANIALYQSEFERAEDLYQQALALQRKEDDVQGAAISLGNLGIIAAEQGDFAAARSFLEESLTLREELGHERDIAQVLHNLGEVALRGGDYGDARRYLDQSLKMRERLADKLGLAATLHSLGLVSVQEGDRATARRLLDESISMRRELEHRWGLAYALYDLGQLALEETDSGRAAQLYREALELNHSLKNTQGIVQCLEACSRLLGLQKKYSDAVAVLAAAQVLRRTNGLAAAEPEQRRLEEHLQQLREALPRNSFEDVWEKGAAWSSDEAVAYSLGSLTNFTPSPLPE
jgi:Tfp pilus assembly protein PilF